MAYIDYTLAWGRLIRQDEEPSDGYSLVWGEVKTYYIVTAGQVYDEICGDVFNAELTSGSQIEIKAGVQEVMKPSDLGSGPLTSHHRAISDFLLRDQSKLLLLLDLASKGFLKHEIEGQCFLTLSQENSEFVKVSSSNMVMLSIDNILKSALKVLSFSQTLNYIDGSIANTLKMLDNIGAYSVLLEEILNKFGMLESKNIALEFVKQARSILNNISFSNYLSYIDVDISSIVVLAERKLSYLEQVLQSYSLLKLDETASVNFNILQSIMEMISFFTFVKFFNLLDAFFAEKFGAKSESQLHPIIRPKTMGLLVEEEKISGRFEISSQLGQAISFLEKNGINLVLALEIIARSYYLSILSYAVTELGVEEFDFTIKVRDRICEVKVSKNELTVKVSREQ